jgi:hypothetical protein
VRVVIGSLLLAAVLAPFSAGSAAAPTGIVVTRDSLALPSGCSPRDVAGFLLRFEAAFNSGNRLELDRLFARPGARPPGFQWFTNEHGRIFDRRLLIPFLLRRHASGERMRLLAVDIGPGGDSNSVGLGFRLADEHGKAALDCAHRRLFVWSSASGSARSGCPEGPQRVGRTVVACARSGRTPLAQEVSPEFTVVRTPSRLPARCSPDHVKASTVRTLRAFNVGDMNAFGQGFAQSALVQPYTAASPFLQLTTRSAVMSFARKRYAKGDGWTATKLVAPRGPFGRPAEGIYQLGLRISALGERFGDGLVKLAVDCRTGRITKWAGPALAPPP